MICDVIYSNMFVAENEEYSARDSQNGLRFL